MGISGPASARRPAGGEAPTSPDRLPTREALTLAITLWVPLWVLVIGLVMLHQRFDVNRLVGLSRILGSSSILLAAGVAALSLARWRLKAEVRDLQIGLAVLLFGVLQIGVSDFVATPLANHHVSKVLEACAAIALVLTIAAFGASTSRSAVSALFQEWRVRASIVPVFVGSLVAVAFAPTFRSLLAGYTRQGLSYAAQFAVFLTIAAVWAVLAGVFWRMAHRDGRASDIWVAAMLLGFAQSRLLLALNGHLGPGAAIGSQVFGLTALLLVVAGLSHEMHRGLLLSQTMVHSLLQQRRTEEALRNDRQHDVRAAFFSIGSALESLSRDVDTIDRRTLDQITRALTAETARLRALVVDQQRDAVRPFNVAEVLEPLIVCERALGQTVNVEVIGDPTAEGRPSDTAEVVRNLLDNARVHAPGSAVHVLVDRAGPWVEIRVADEGLGVPESERSAIFRRGHRGTGVVSSGSGLGLYLSARLMQDQQGDIGVAATPGGGAMFTVRLHAAPAPVIALSADDGSRRPLERERDDSVAG